MVPDNLPEPERHTSDPKKRDIWDQSNKPQPVGLPSESTRELCELQGSSFGIEGVANSKNRAEENETDCDPGECGAFAKFPERVGRLFSLIVHFNPQTSDIPGISGSRLLIDLLAEARPLQPLHEQNLDVLHSGLNAGCCAVKYQAV